MSILKWNKEHTDFVKTYYPHAGIKYCAEKLNRTYESVSRRVYILKLKRIEPKEKRLCIKCLTNYQMPLISVNISGTNYGKLCKECHKKHTKVLKKNRSVSIEQQLKKHLTNCINRSIKKGLKLVTITLEDLIEKWNLQRGKCYYSGEQMVTTKYGTKRSPYTVSMDQKIPSNGYTKENIVLCCWFANAGKDENSEEEYIQFCRKVIIYQDNKKD